MEDEAPQVVTSSRRSRRAQTSARRLENAHNLFDTGNTLEAEALHATTWKDIPESGEEAVYQVGFLGGACSARGSRRIDPEAVSQICSQFGLEHFQVQQCYEAFCRADKSRVGSLTEEELSQVLNHMCEGMLGTESQRELIQAYGVAGKIDFEKFLAIFSNVIAGGVESKWDDVCRGLKVMCDKEEQAAAKEDAPLEVPDIVVAQWLQSELNEADACMQLPTAILLFTVYCAAVLMHEKMGVLRAISLAISFDIVENANFAFSGDVPIENGRMGFKNVMDVNSIPDFWSWISMGFVPLVWPEAWDVSEPRANVLAACTKPVDALNNWTTIWPQRPSPALSSLPAYLSDPSCPEDFPKGMPETILGSIKNDRGLQNNMYLYFNRVVGGVRLRQERSEKKECAVSSELASKIYNADCFSGSYWLSPDYREAFNFDDSLSDHPSAPSHVLRTGLPQYDIRTQLKRLEEAIWFTPATQRVEVTLMTYNANADALTLTYVNFYFTHAGQIWKRIEPMSIWLNPYSSVVNYVLDLVWFCMLLRVLCMEGLEVCQSVYRHGLRKGFIDYFHFWNVVDWTSALYGMVIFGIWIHYLTEVNAMVEILKTARLDIAGSWQSDSEILDHFAAGDALVKFTVSMRRVFLLYPFIVILRMFKSFDAQKRMSLVTSTLQTSATDVAHFAVVFMSIFLAYAISGMILFGQELERFASFWRSVNTCWRLLLGSFEWEDLRNVSRVEAALWFWTFTILVLLVMLNMFIALVMEAYMNVKAGIQDDQCETLVSQCLEIKNRYQQVRAGTHLHLEHILKQLACEDPYDEDAQEMLTLETFKERVPGIPEAQALEIIQEALKLYENEVDDTEDSMNMNVLVMSNRQEGIQCGIEQLGKICLTISGLVKQVNANSGGLAHLGSKHRIADSVDEADASVLLNQIAENAAKTAEDQLRSLLLRHKLLLEHANNLQKTLQDKLIGLEARLTECDVRLAEERQRRARASETLHRLPNGEVMCPGCSEVEVAPRPQTTLRISPGIAPQRPGDGNLPAALR